MISIGERIKEIRTNRGKTQLELAEAIGKTRYMICKYENNSTIPSGNTLIKIANCLNTNIDYLTGREDNGYMITFYSNYLDKNSISKIVPFQMVKNSDYFAILSNFCNDYGIKDNDMLVFMPYSCEILNKMVLVEYLSTQTLFGFLWGKNGVKMLSIKNDQEPIDISDTSKYKIVGVLSKLIRDFE